MVKRREILWPAPPENLAEVEVSDCQFVDSHMVRATTTLGEKETARKKRPTTVTLDPPVDTPFACPKSVPMCPSKEKALVKVSASVLPEEKEKR